mmetsp:Transcript_14111/g.44331  ORF Transcript_14111/g.44331 Transcript_14111/m.44331 type:complete len:205 (-) Transcript_14111:279-893(-)
MMPSRYATRSCTVAWPASRRSFSCDRTPCTELCCLSLMAFSPSNLPLSASIFLCASESASRCWSAESWMAPSRKATRSSMVACCAWAALRASRSLAYLPWAASCLACEALRACSSLEWASAESPSTCSMYSMRSGSEAWASLTSCTSFACLAWASLSALSSLACLSAESPSIRSTYLIRSSTVAWRSPASAASWAWRSWASRRA